MNEKKLEQDHPCVLEMIRRHFLHPPSPRDVPYSFANITEFEYPGTDIEDVFDPNGDPSMGQTHHILKLLRNMVLYHIAYRPKNYGLSDESIYIVK